jgi:hypothetical protein
MVRSGSWWAAELQSFPGAHGQGKTPKAAYVNLLGAIRDLMDAYADRAAETFPQATRLPSGA